MGANLSSDRTDEEYELAHVLEIDAANLTSLNVSTVQVGVSRGECLEDRLCEDTDALVYSYRLSELTCQEWDEENEVWITGNCEVSILSYIFIAHLIPWFCSIDEVKYTACLLIT